MKLNTVRTFAFALAFLAAGLLPRVAQAQAQWSVGYLENTSSTSLSAINWSAFTHIDDFTVGPNSNGTLACDFGANSCTSGTFPTTRAALISTAHSHGVKVLLCITDGVGDKNFPSATSSGTVSTFVSNIHTLVTTLGYDGVDIDWEASFGGSSQMAPFLAALRTSLGSGKLITAAAIATEDISYWGAHHANLDRVMFMTYDLAGSWNPYAWFNSPIHSDSCNCVWSLDLVKTRAAAAGIPASMYGIGIPFYGYVSSGGGVTAPRQTGGYSLAQTTYGSLVSRFASQIASATLDGVAQSPWFAVSGGWVTFDNAASVAAHVNWVKANGVGGWIAFSITKDDGSHTLANALAAAIGGGGGGGGTLPIISSFSASPGSITSGSSSTLSWSVSGATSLSISPGIGTVTGSSKSVSPASTTTYTLTATDSTGSVSQSSTVTVNPAGTAPTISSFACSPSTISSGSSSTCSWSQTGGTSQSISPGGTVTGTSKSESPTSTTTYTLTETNAFGSTSKSATVTVTTVAPLINSFTVSPGTISPGGSATLAWSTSNGSTITITPPATVGGSTTVAASGSESVGPKATATYTLTVSNTGGTVSQSITVNVTSPVAAPTQLKGTITLTGNVKIQ